MTQSTPSFSYSLPGTPAMSAADFDRAVRLIKNRSGIILGNHKEDMVARNLGIHAKRLKVDTIQAYLDHLEFNTTSTEWDRFISIFTINHTAFYRERHHFDILADFVRGLNKPIAVWSSACSTGEEAYSIALTLYENVLQPESGVYMLATDIDTTAVERARQGIYTLDRVQPVPLPELRKYFYRGTGGVEGMAKVKSFLREYIEFDVLNLVTDQQWPQGRKFDAVFCRNTMIYFDKHTQTQLLKRFAQVIKPGGLLFVGHSENFSQMTSDFKLQGQTVYVRL